jgi:hypothetical protein
LLLLRAGRAAAEFTLRVARPELLKELRAAWMMALQRLVSALARVLLETRPERLRLLLAERLQVLAVRQLRVREQQALGQAWQMLREQWQRALGPLV